MMNRRIVVTGATGVIGVHLVPMLVRAGHRVTAIGRTEEKRAQLQRLGARAVGLDFFDETAARRMFEGHDTVINLATHMPSSTWRMLLPWSWRENDRVRREGSATLVAAAIEAGVERFIQESFAPIYADGGDAWLDESSPVAPAPHARSVLDAERSAAHFTARGGTGIVLRFAGLYGPDPMLHDMLDVVRRGWSPLPGRADAYWSAIAHEDAASACAAALDVPAGTYNVCDDEPLTRRAIAGAFAAAIGAAPPRLMPHWMTRLGGPVLGLLARSQRMTNQSFKWESGWRPRWRSMRDGLPAVVAAMPAKSERPTALQARS